MACPRSPLTLVLLVPALITTLGANCSTETEVQSGPTATVTVDVSASTFTVAPHFLSYAIDTSQVAGGNWWSPDGFEEEVEPWDFSRERLRTLAKELSPALMRIGGSEADSVYYDLSDTPAETPPEPYEHTFTKTMFDDLCAFATDVGAQVFFTLNAGPGPRTEELVWTDNNARQAMQYMRDIDCPVFAWELGNEINGFIALHGPEYRVTGEQYADDVVLFEALRDDIDGTAPYGEGGHVPIAGPSSAFWPFLGELAPIYPEFMEVGGGESLDVITWHYYPQQSDRCPIQSQKAEVETLLRDDALDEILVHQQHVQSYRDQYAPNARVWLGETGHAQCGGQRGVSGTFVSSLWWLDTLGLMAKTGQDVVVRQTLAGADYQMIDDATLEATPDYLASVLWKRWMGPRVLDVQVAESEGSRLRAYAHCAPDGVAPLGDAPEPVTANATVVLININRLERAHAFLPELKSAQTFVRVVESDALTSRTTLVNGENWTPNSDGSLPPIPVRPVLSGPVQISLPPASYAFVHTVLSGTCQD